MYSGVALPLAALFSNMAVVGAWPQPSSDAGVDDGGLDGGGIDAGPTMRCGTLALIPPDRHEYGHTLGFIDLYNGPTVNDLMADTATSLGAFSRQQIGWGEVVPVTGDVELDLKPVFEGGSILRIGDAPRYLLIENRGGPQHARYEQSHAGIYVYSINETKLPVDPTGWLDLPRMTLYFPNQTAPYLYVNVPLRCDIGTSDTPGTCGLTRYDEARVLSDSAGQPVGFTIRRSSTQDGGTVRIALRQGMELPPSFDPPPKPPDPKVVPAVPMPWEAVRPGCGCNAAGSSAFVWLMGLLWRRRRS